MQATFRPLQKHGGAGLSIGRTAEEADLSKSSVDHFFEDKGDLILTFFDAMLAHCGPPLGEERAADPESAFWEHVDIALARVSGDRIPPVTSNSSNLSRDVRPYNSVRRQSTTKRIGTGSPTSRRGTMTGSPPSSATA